ncbi:SET domain [Seminavis robusta]|uniref:SET domain n=1 Tax=Seminavis robusta TaxID=568900 RepID=A0A9N8HVY9_9STRA|nr:SET domain [Seminavis robusta]|eukprot:Sro2094_g314160.1 SET domain (381) ;mRNA; r:9118-10260
MGRSPSLLCRILMAVPLVASLSTVVPPSVSKPTTTTTNKCNIIPKSDNEESQLEAFHKWADDNGIQRKVQVHQDTTAGGGRGLIATERIEPGEVAARVPLSAVMRLEHDVKHNVDDQWAGILASGLLQESQLGQSSRWAPYLATLPSDAPLTPCRWNSEQRHNLQNQTLSTMILENSEWRKRQCNQHCCNREQQHAAVVEYMKWLDLVCSRTLKGRDGSRQLVPLIDIANHAPSEAGGGHFVVDQDAVYLLAGSRGVDAGQAVTLDYGARNVDDFLLHYGFVPHRCIGDSVTVMVGEEPVTVAWRDCQGYRGHAQEEVRTACATMLASYPTTLEEDVVRLNHGDASSEADQWAVAYRYAKKSLLASAVGVQQRQSAFAAL